MTVLCDIYDVISRPDGYANTDLEYFDSMLHAVPKLTIIKNREAYITEQCKDMGVINFGCASGGLHGLIKGVARWAIGVDKNDPCDFKMDLDDIIIRTQFKGADSRTDLLICGEVVEHLSNPGKFLDYLRRYQAPVIITVPNAFAEIARRHMMRGYENVNPDHVCWYSYRTLKTLVERVGFKIEEAHWYGPGNPGFNEGLIFKVS
jgi:hypothetical protein